MDEFDFDQGMFNFDAAAPEDGWRNWRRELDEKRRAFESRHGVILGRRVVVQLAGHDKPVEGVVHVIPPQPDEPPAGVRFTIRGIEFQPGEILSIVRVAP